MIFQRLDDDDDVDGPHYGACCARERTIARFTSNIGECERAIALGVVCSSRVSSPTALGGKAEREHDGWVLSGGRAGKSPPVVEEEEEEEAGIINTHSVVTHRPGMQVLSEARFVCSKNQRTHLHTQRNLTRHARSFGFHIVSTVQPNCATI